MVSSILFWIALAELTRLSAKPLDVLIYGSLSPRDYR
jgi:hypothetical protein